MPKKKKVEKVVEEVSVPTEKENLETRRLQLLHHLDFMDSNKFQDYGQMSVALEQVNQRLTQL